MSKNRILHVLTHIGALLPLAITLFDLIQGQLTANPIKEITLRFGRTAITLLLLSLSVTPVHSILRVRGILPLRRLLGLYTFFYVCLHLFMQVGVDYRFDLGLFIEDIGEKRFALFGFSAFLILIPLAITSTRGWQRRLGKQWERLHLLVYIAALLAATHFILQAKADFRTPFLYAAIMLSLILLRLPAIKSAADWLWDKMRGKS